MRFSPEQIQALEQRFQEQQYLLPADRKILSVTLRMTERQIKTWFQNKRAQFKRSRLNATSVQFSNYTTPSMYTTPATLIGPNIPAHQNSLCSHMTFRFQPATFPPPFPFNDHKHLFLSTPPSPVVMGTPRMIYTSLGNSYTPTISTTSLLRSNAAGQ